MSAAAAGTKRKERDFEADVVVGGGEESNINVVVRCRGRSQREVKENSAVVVNSDGVKGQMIELSMGANALSNKSYSFDRVFSPAADQAMVFDDTVKPILEEVGFYSMLSQNCCELGRLHRIQNVLTGLARCLPVIIVRYLPTDRQGRARHTQCQETCQTH